MWSARGPEAAFPHFRDDLIRAIKKLKALGTGFGIIPVGGTYLIQSVPAELNMDHTVVLQLAEVLVCLSGRGWGDSQDCREEGLRKQL